MRRIVHRAAAAVLAAAFSLAAWAAPEATSPDGRWRVLGGDAQVRVLDRDQPVRTLPARSLAGSEDAEVLAVRFLPARRSFVVAFAAPMRELWELSVDPDAPPVFDGLVHDHRMAEAIATPGFLGVRRTPLEAPAEALAADAAGGPFLLLRDANGWQLLNLDARRAIARYARELPP